MGNVIVIKIEEEEGCYGIGWQSRVIDLIVIVIHIVQIMFVYIVRCIVFILVIGIVMFIMSNIIISYNYYLH